MTFVIPSFLLLQHFKYPISKIKVMTKYFQEYQVKSCLLVAVYHSLCSVITASSIEEAHESFSA